MGIQRNSLSGDYYIYIYIYIYPMNDMEHSLFINMANYMYIYIYWEREKETPEYIYIYRKIVQKFFLISWEVVVFATTKMFSLWFYVLGEA